MFVSSHLTLSSGTTALAPTTADLTPQYLLSQPSDSVLTSYNDLSLAESSVQIMSAHNNETVRRDTVRSTQVCCLHCLDVWLLMSSIMISLDEWRICCVWLLTKIFSQMTKQGGAAQCKTQLLSLTHSPAQSH